MLSIIIMMIIIRMAKISKSFERYQNLHLGQTDMEQQEKNAGLAGAGGSLGEDMMMVIMTVVVLVEMKSI